MTLHIDVTRTGGRISPLWFGHNLEHTRSCVWRGLSAQLIRNRKFAGKPARTGVAMDWYPIGPDRNWFWADSESGGYTVHYDPEDVRRTGELVCQRMECFVQGDVCGIGQREVPLSEGREYEGRVVMRTEQALSVRVRVAGADASRTLFEERFDVAPDDWRTCAFRFRMPATDVHARLEIAFEGPGRLAVGAVSLLPGDHFHGMRRDVVRLLKEMSVPILRWPGGNFAGDYRWKDGLLDVDRRGPLAAFMEIETLPHTRGVDNHEIGTDEFLALCRELGAEPFISINLAWDGPEGAAAWVEYCNGAASTPWGKLRAGRGHVEPYNVTYWSLGNELGYAHMEGPNSPVAYAEKAGACAEAMHAVDPSLRLTMAGFWRNDAWFDDALPVLAPQIDCFAHHWYTRNAKHYAGEDGKREFRRILKRVDEDLEDLRKYRAHADAVTAGRHVGISFDEWNVWYAWYRTPDVIDGVHAACMLNMFCRSAEAVDMRIGCFFEPVNEGAIVVEPDGARLTPVGKVFVLWKAHQGNTLIPLNAAAAPDVDAAASRDQDSGEVVVTLVNRSPDETRQAVLDFANVGGLTVTEGVLLCAENFLPASDFTEETLDAAVGEGGTLAVSLPKHSVARIRVDCGPRD